MTELVNKYEFLCELVSCNYDVFFGVYDKEMNLISSTCPDAEKISQLFLLENTGEYLRNYIHENPAPAIFSNSLDLVWAVIPEYRNESVAFLHTLGPVFTDQISVKRRWKCLEKYSLSAKTKQATIKLFDSFPTISITNLLQCAIMLYYCVNNMKISVGDFNYYQTANEAKAINAENLEATSLRTNGNLSYAYEQRLSKMVEEGNLNYLSKPRQNNIPFDVGKLSQDDPLRQAKNMALNLIHICSRAAIRGGLSPDESYLLSDNYTQSVESCTTATDVYAINRLIQEDYIKRVHKCKLKNGYSMFLKQCCDYIDLYFLEDFFSLDSISSNLGYSTSYMGRRFKKEMGISIQEYINQKKIEYSKQLLSTTTQNMVNISEQLHYCSSSYYAALFLKQTGMTPSEYRQKNINQEEQ